MSTCPDTSLFSAYVDGEVPSPWKEKLEEHLATCEKCRAVERRYRALRGAMRQISAREPAVTDEFLESSFKKLSPRWEIAAEKAAAERSASAPTVSRRSVTIPWAALAAMFLVAVFVPSFFAVKAMEGHAPESPPPMQAAQNDNDAMFLAGFQNGGGYGRQGFPAGGGAVYVTAGAEGGFDFTLINQARMFSQDKEALSAPSSGYVIIRLPEMVRFRGAPPERERESPERGIAPMRQRAEDWRGGSGYIINVRQQ